MLKQKEDTQLSTAWMPLDGLIKQWDTFGTGSPTSSELQAAGMAFCALSRETEALASYTAAQPLSHQVHYSANLEYTLNGLLQARQFWTETMQALEPLLLDDRKQETPHDAIRTLIIEAMEQRSRLSVLINEVECEQLAAYRRQNVEVQV